MSAGKLYPTIPTCVFVLPCKKWETWDLWRNTPMLFATQKTGVNTQIIQRCPQRTNGAHLISQSHMPDLNPAHTSRHPPPPPVVLPDAMLQRPKPFSRPTLNPIYTLHPRLSSQPVRGWLPMSITEWWMRWKVVTPLCRVQWSHQPCRHHHTTGAKCYRNHTFVEFKWKHLANKRVVGEN